SALAAAAPPAEVVKVAATVAAPPAAFARCAVCHTADKGGEDKLGPNLYGVFGKPMGRGGFAFSDAVKGSGLVLDAATLDKWIENPKALVPGNRMSFPGIKDPAKRQELIAYLKQQS
ncbi:MAG: c-type cytochrome, partial [Tagaea sp.]